MGGGPATHSINSAGDLNPDRRWPLVRQFSEAMLMLFKCLLIAVTVSSKKLIRRKLTSSHASMTIYSDCR